MKTPTSNPSQAEFNPYRCGNCGQSDDLKTCSGCRLISFCSTNCQKNYWARHQSLCQLITQIIRIDKKNSVFDVRREDLDEVDGAKRLMKSIVLLNKKLPELLGRDLTFEEHLLLTHPKYCEVCYETNTTRLLRCQHCKFSSFCKTGDCRTKSTHHVHCPQKRLAFLCYRDCQYEEIFNTKPISLDFNEFLKNTPDLFDFIEQITTKKFIRNPKNREQMVSFATVCQFNFTLTIIKALFHLNLLQTDRETLFIDIVGAKYEETYFNTQTCSIFFSCLPKLHSIKLNLIGPELSASLLKEIDCFGNTVKIGYHKMLYQNYQGSDPDLIVCFNCGFSEELLKPDNDWVCGVKKILNLRIPFTFTSYTKSELIDEIKFVRQIACEMGFLEELTGVFWGENNFKDMRPFQNFDKASEEPLFYGNNKMCVISWKEHLSEEFKDLKSLFENEFKQ